MKFSKLASLVVLALGTIAGQANAGFTSAIDSVNKVSQDPLATDVHFGNTPAGVNGSGLDDVYTDGFATFEDGALYTDSISGITARPAGAEPGNTFWSVGTSPALQAGPGVLSFANVAPVLYVGFLWGSIDDYNTVTFYNGANVLASFSGASLPPATGDQSTSKYFDFYATGGDKITKVTFASKGNAFETANFAYTRGPDYPTSSIPEPESYAMMLAGLGLMGAIARRRKSKAA